MATLEKRSTAHSSISRVGTKTALETARSKADLEAAIEASSLAREPSQPIEPQRTSEGIILVDWYSTSDQENPQNWSQKKKAFASGLVCLYTLAVYMGSAIYTPSEEGVMKRFGVGPEVASLGLALYDWLN